MTSAVRPKPKTTAKTSTKTPSKALSKAPAKKPQKAARTSRTPAAPQPPSAPPSRALPAGTINHFELIELVQRGALIEIVIPEVEPGRYQVHLVVLWHVGRSVLTGSSGQPRTFRSLDTLQMHLKTLGIGRTLVRLELLL